MTMMTVMMMTVMIMTVMMMMFQHEVESMDHILEGVMASSHPEAMNRQLIDRDTDHNDNDDDSIDNDNDDNDVTARGREHGLHPGGGDGQRSSQGYDELTVD
ncbi:hypothetical protein ACOMHN_053677 [Nucella lapillus]